MTTETEQKSLSRRVAEHLGWQFIKVNKKDGRTLYKVFRPDGSVVAGVYNNFVKLWREEQLASHYPNYEHDLNAAVRDCRMAGYVLHFMQTIDGWRAWYATVYIDGQLTVYGTRIDETEMDAAEPAEAVCLAFEALCAVVAKGKAESI